MHLDVSLLLKVVLYDYLVAASLSNVAGGFLWELAMYKFQPEKISRASAAGFNKEATCTQPVMTRWLYTTVL